MRLPASTLGRLALLALATLILSGCASPRASEIRRDSAAGLYDRATLNYELDASQLSLPLALTQVEGQLVSYEQFPSHPVPGATRGKLTLTYPHPNGHPGQALARVDILSDMIAADASVPPPAGGWSEALRSIGRSAGEALSLPSSQPITESWELTITKSELDEAIIGLNKAGYFGQLDPASTGATIAASLDGSQMQKPWAQVPQLDSLMQRTRNQGQLVAYHRPPAFRTDTAFGSSVASYRALRERELLRGTPSEHAIVSTPLPDWSAGRHGLADPTPQAQSSVARLPAIDAPQRY